MILYFSASGNSHFVAQALGRQLQDPVVDLNKRIKSGNHQPLVSDTPFVLSCPIFAWRIPHLVEDYLRATPLHGNDKVYLMVTTSGSSGSAGEYAQKFFEGIGKKWMGWYSFPMPGNYIAFMQNPDIAHASQMNLNATKKLEKLAPYIHAEAPLPPYPITGKGRFMSQIANPLFYRFIFNRKGFYTTDDCIGCGVCAKVCPINNIQLNDGRPVWKDSCAHCMACVHRCPKQAIEFQKITKGKNRYYNPGI